MGAVAIQRVKSEHDDPLGSLTANPSYELYVFGMSLFGKNLAGTMANVDDRKRLIATGGALRRIVFSSPVA